METEEPIVSIILFVPRTLAVAKNVIGLCVTMAVTLVAMAFEETAEKSERRTAMINGENILYLGVLVIVVYFAMNYATYHPSRDSTWVKLLSFAPPDAPDSAKLTYDWGKLVMFVGLGLQVFDIALYVGLVMFIIGFFLTMNARQSFKKDDDNG